MRTLTLLLLSVLLASGCSITKDIAGHQERLLAALGPDVPLADKRDALGYSAVGMMHEAVDRLNPKKGVQYVKAYAKTNGPLVDSLVAQISAAQKEMSDAEGIAFMLGAANESYVQDAFDLIPRFVKRYRQIDGIVNLTGKLKGVLLGKLGDRLGGFGDADYRRRDGQLPLDAHRERKEEGRTR